MYISEKIKELRVYRPPVLSDFVHESGGMVRGGNWSNSARARASQQARQEMEKELARIAATSQNTPLLRMLPRFAWHADFFELNGV